MRFTSHLHFHTKLPAEFRKAFISTLNLENTERIFVTCWTGLIVFALLLIIDYQRFMTGEFYEKELYRYLFYNHLGGVLFLVPLLIIWIKKKSIQQASYNPKGVIIAMMIILIFTLLVQTTLTFMDRRNLVLYMIYILIANWVITLSHPGRIIFNVLSLGIMLAVIFIIGQESATELIINVYEAMGFTLLAFLFSTFDYNLRGEKFLQDKLLEREKGRIQDLEKFKSSMYTNLTHEFRTPLTVISGTAELSIDLLEKEDKEALIQGADTIVRNSDNILNLVNQMLDLAKLESKAMELHLEQKDIIAFSHSVIQKMESIAVRKKVHLKLTAEEPYFMMDFDEEKLWAVVSNLLSNAIKFNQEDGEVVLNIKIQTVTPSKVLIIQVDDTGYGIGKEHLPYVFDRFYQAEAGPTRKTTGTGIGLALTRELIHLMGGQISVESVLGQGTIFTIRIPITNDAPPGVLQAASEISESKSKSLSLAKKSVSEKPLLLIIEDEPDVQNYLALLLENDYIIELATNGKEGLAKAERIIPDIIISDVMMPERDGFSLAQELKENKKTDHIPILLLTALADTDDRIEGWRSGADAYLTKPFKKEELRAILENLELSRKKLREKFSQFTLIDNPEALKKESEFIYRINGIIEQHVSDENFTVEDLAKKVFLSRMQLHRKLKALADRSASNYIRTFRLHRSLPLLADLSRNIAEIAFDVGFPDPNYFSKSFQKEFGKTPSDYRKQGSD